MTITGLESLLLGAHAEGVRNVLAVTGDPPEAGDYPGTGAVYDVDSIGLVELIARLNSGEDWHGRAIDAPTSFFPGVAVNPTADDLGLEAERFHRKVAAGARFAMTQILFDLEPLEAFRERLGGAWPIPVLAGVWPIRTTETLVRVHNEVPGIVVPEQRAGAVRSRRRRRARGRPRAGQELIAHAREVANGVYVVAPFRQPLNVVELLPELILQRRSSVETAWLPASRGRCGRSRSGRRIRSASPLLREDRRLDAAEGVDHRAAGVALVHLPGDGGDRALDRAVAERVLRERVRGAPDAAGGRGEVPVERIADDRDRGSVLRIGHAQRLRGRARDAKDGDVVVDVEDDDGRGVVVRVAGDLDDRAVLAGDDVRRGDDEIAAARTSRSLPLRRRTRCRAPSRRA